jgi:FkbM family methyltransferase
MTHSFARKVLIALEASGGHKLISLLATRWARNLTKLDIEIFYDDVWMLRFEDSFLPRQECFDIYASDIQNLRFKRTTLLREPIDHWTHLYTPRLTDVVVDVGAGSGTDTLVFSDLVGTLGKVYAFEAHPTTFRRLQKTCKWNQLGNVVAVPYAVWSERCALWISDLEEDVSNKVTSAGQNVTSLKVEAIDLDAFIEEHKIEKIDFLKMNIEGAERMAIRGMKKTISITRYVAIACHDFLDQEGSSEQHAIRDAVIDFLRKHNFEIAQRPDDPRAYVRDHIYGKSRTIS